MGRRGREMGMRDGVRGLRGPEAGRSKIIAGAGDWSVRKPRYGDPAFCLMLQGSCVLEPDGLDSVALSQGDFLLFPEMPGFTLGDGGAVASTVTPLDPARHTRHGCEAAPERALIHI